METYAETYDYHHHHPHSGQNFQPAASATSAQGSNPERHVLAERYKTKMCRNYVQTGECPYEVRCMFAHGDHELRTCEMNIRDGLISEESIKAFQRVLNMRNRMNHAHQASMGYMPDYVGLPPMDVGPCRYTHNPYGYSVARPTTPEEYYPSSMPATKVDPSVAMEP